MVAKSLQLVVWSPEGRMNGSQESPTGSLKSRRKDERNTGKLLTLWNHPGNDGKQPSMDKVKNFHARWRRRDTTSTFRGNPRSSIESGLPRTRQRIARTCQSQNREFDRIKCGIVQDSDQSPRKYWKQTQGMKNLYFCIVHSCVITCIPSSKTLPPGRLLHFTEIH